MKDKLSTISTAALAICAVALTGMSVRREFFAPQPVPAGERVVRDWKSYLSAGQRIGPADAAVTIVEFSDFQCPACRNAAGNLREVRERYAGQVALLYRHAPIPSHAFATDAARASICAAEQGRFEAYHDALFARQDSIGRVPWSDFARSARVPDAAAFSACMEKKGPVPALEADERAAHQLGVRATPTLLINDRLITGSPEKEELTRLIDAALREKRSSR